jgi:hypothetical protein
MLLPLFGGFQSAPAFNAGFSKKVTYLFTYLLIYSMVQDII